MFDKNTRRINFWYFLKTIKKCIQYVLKKIVLNDRIMEEFGKRCKNYYFKF